MAKGRIVLEQISCAFDAERPLFRDISLAIEPGRIVALMGASGAGKSSLARICAGIEQPAEGRVFLDGVALDAWAPIMLRRSLQYVPQQSALFSGSIEDNVTLWSEGLAQGAAQRALLAVGLHDLLHTRAGGSRARLAAHAPSLSGGEVQRLALARALAREPVAIVLDEATSALDGESEARVFQSLRARGVTAIVVTHRLDTAARCDDVYVLEGGRLVQRAAGQTPGAETAARSAA